jgi:hypothetical protein
MHSPENQILCLRNIRPSSLFMAVSGINTKVVGSRLFHGHGEIIGNLNFCETLKETGETQNYCGLTGGGYI